jgi:hypothetical protein
MYLLLLIANEKRYTLQPAESWNPGQYDRGGRSLDAH